MTAFEIPSATQSSFPLSLCDLVCASLQHLAPVGVLCLLLSLLVPAKGRRFTGGRSPLGKLPCSQKVTAVDIGKGDVPVDIGKGYVPVQEDVTVAQSGEDVPMALGLSSLVVGPPSEESSGRLVKALVGPPSEESSGRFVKPSVSATSIASPSEASPVRFVKP
jgi:hypothetical protein